MSTPLAIIGTGLVTSVGLTAPAACAAIRAKISNPTETRFVADSGNWIHAHQVQLPEPIRGLARLARMAAMAMEEALGPVQRAEWQDIPLILCLPERDRPGRIDRLDDAIFDSIQHELDTVFALDHSLLIPHGRASIGVAMQHARRHLESGNATAVLVAATDTLLTWSTLSAYERAGRLLSEENSNGFMPGEGAGALLVSRSGRGSQLLCTGIGVASEPAHLDSGLPLRADGMVSAIRSACMDAATELHHLDFRITDISGEHYYFKEAALALSRILRVRVEEFDMWHPAESIGEVGALSGLAPLVVADIACRKGYACGANILCHASNDGGLRSAVIMQFAS